MRHSFYEIDLTNTVKFGNNQCQAIINVTHLSRKNKAIVASDHSPSRSLSSLHRWKADPKFTRVLHGQTVPLPSSNAHVIQA